MKCKNRSEVFNLIDQERENQDEKWGGVEHDKQHTPLEWVIIIEHLLHKAKQTWTWNGNRGVMEEIRTIAGVAVAAMEYNETPQRVPSGGLPVNKE